MKNYKIEKLLTGYLRVPSDHIIAKSTRTAVSDHAGIVTDDKGFLPMYVVFSDIPIHFYTDEGKYHLFEKLGEEFGEVTEVLHYEADPVYYGENLMNAEEVYRSPHMVLFPIKEMADSEFNRRHYGTAIFRKNVSDLAER